MKLTIIVLILFISLTVSGCAGTGNNSNDDVSGIPLGEDMSQVEDIPTAEELPLVEIEYKKLTPEQAKDMLESDKDIILLDVRTEEEFRETHIPGAVLLPDTMVAESAPEMLPDKDAKILVYCRAGRRSENASRELISMGYTNIYDIGGIIDLGLLLPP